MENQASPPSPRPADAVPGGLRFAIRKLVRGASRAALATSLAADGRPYASLVTVATDVDGSPLLLLSGLADHTRNLQADPHLSLLFDGTEGYANPQEGPRVTLLGEARRSDEERLRRRFLARHPAAALYAGFGDFAVYRVAVERAHWVGGFARAVWLDQRLACETEVAAAFAAAEGELLEQMNSEHPLAVGRLANRLLGRAGEGWRMVAIDPDGCDLALKDIVHRLHFDRPVSTVVELRQWLTGIAVAAAPANPATLGR
jgi:heme iron utilization protein